MIIGISGKKQSGKDTLATELVSVDKAFEPRSFAHNLKAMCAILTGEEDQWSHRGKAVYLPAWQMTVGEIQQKFGTECVRNGLLQDAWIISLFRDYTPGSCWIISDVRMPNEAEYIRKLGGLLVRIEGVHAHDNSRSSEHTTEVGLDTWTDWDYTFDNSSGTPNTIRQHALAIMSLAWKRMFPNSLYLKLPIQSPRYA